MSTLITSLFHSPKAANHAVDQLLTSGFSQSNISMLMSDATQGREFTVTTETKAPEGATAGAAIGGVLGALVASLVAVGSLAIPGIGLVAAGPIVAALAGLGAGGAAGGLVGALVGLGVPEHEAKLYSEKLADGGILVGVYTSDGRAGLAKDVLDAAGGQSVKAA
jgi:hypothetical protein